MTTGRAHRGPGSQPPGLARRVAGATALAGGAVVAGLLAGRLLGGALPDAAPGAGTLWVLAVYALVLALPFVPGVELGLAVLAMYGAAGAPIVWGATVVGLCLAHAAGRLIPPRRAAGLLRRLGLRRACRLALRLAPLSREARLAHLVSAAPSRAVPWLLRHRHLALALALNLPGNAVLGGGGGLALAAGLSGLYGALPFALTVAVATAPLPLLALLIG